ncbi:MAG: hypothetical protein IPG50_33735 [Myxococcales bacterium]|nr:hypothetical protein [Myxococcales bacterium]
MRLMWILASCVGLACACYEAPPEKGPIAGAPALTASGPFTLRGRLVDADTKAPLTDSLVVIEVGGRYIPNPDPSKGHPDYRYVAATRADGVFELTVPPGVRDGKVSAEWGLHTFQNGYKYGTDLVKLDANGAPQQLELTVKAMKSDDVKPTATEFKVEPTVVVPGGNIVFTALVRSPAGDFRPDRTIVDGEGRPATFPDADPLSEEVLLAETKTGWARAMAPPFRGIQGKAFPNGVWRYEGTAPTEPGSYTFHLVVSNESCNTSDRVSIKLDVAPDGGLGPSPAAPACNTVPSLDGQLVLEQVAAAAPVPQGGVIADGTYTLSAYRLYTGVGGPSGPKAGETFHETAIYKGSELQVNYGDSTFNVQETYRHEVSGTAFTHTRTCPAAPPAVFPGTYTASGASLSYFEDRAAPDGGAPYKIEFALTRVK